MPGQSEKTQAAGKDCLGALKISSYLRRVLFQKEVFHMFFKRRSLLIGISFFLSVSCKNDGQESVSETEAVSTGNQKALFKSVQEAVSFAELNDHRLKPVGLRIS